MKQGMKSVKKKEVPGANLFHDRVNLICLPILAAMSAAGLMGIYSPEKVPIPALFLDRVLDSWAEYSTMRRRHIRYKARNISYDHSPSYCLLCSGYQKRTQDTTLTLEFLRHIPSVTQTHLLVNMKDAPNLSLSLTLQSLNARGKE